jgi:hypothetical protein
MEESLPLVAEEQEGVLVVVALALLEETQQQMLVALAVLDVNLQ